MTYVNVGKCDMHVKVYLKKKDVKNDLAWFTYISLNIIYGRNRVLAEYTQGVYFFK